MSKRISRAGLVYYEREGITFQPSRHARLNVRNKRSNIIQRVKVGEFRHPFEPPAVRLHLPNGKIIRRRKNSMFRSENQLLEHLYHLMRMRPQLIEEWGLMRPDLVRIVLKLSKRFDDAVRKKIKN